MRYYVYSLSDKNGIFYIGKGTGTRMYVHAHKAKTTAKNHPTLNKIRKMLLEGEEVVYNQIQFFETSKEALDREKELIADIGLENLTNITPGGEGLPQGYVFSEEHRKNLSEATKKAIAEGRRVPLYKGGGEFSEEALAKISQSSKERMTPEMRAHLSEVGKSKLVDGKRVLSEEARQKMRESAARTNQLKRERKAALEK